MQSGNNKLIITLYITHLRSVTTINLTPAVHDDDIIIIIIIIPK